MAYINISRKNGINLNYLAVLNTYNELNSAFLGEVPEGKSIFTTSIEQLYTIYNEVVKAEDQFYTDTGITNIKELQQRIEELNTSGLSILQNQNAHLVIAELMSKGYNIKGLEASKQDIVAQNMKEIFKKEDGAIQNLTSECVEQTIYEMANAVHITLLTPEQLDKFLSQLEKNNKRSFLRKGSYGLPYQIQFLFNAEGEFESIKWAEGSSYYVNKLFDITQTYLKKENNKLLTTKEDIIRALHEIIVPHITNHRVRTILDMEMFKYKDLYDVNTSPASIIGYLGEVHLNVLLKYMFPKQDVSNVGNIRTLKNSQEIGIDTVLNNYGFQVKNYDIEKGYLSFNDRKGLKGSMDSLLERMGAYDRPLKYDELIAEFYGSYQYNQPIKEADEDYLNFYNNDMTFLAFDAQKYFKYNIDRIMRVDQFFSAKQIFQEQKLYFNTFFFIGGEVLVPSSAILMTIINVLEDHISSSNFKFDMNITLSSMPTYQELIDTRADGGQYHAPTLQNVLKSVKVKLDYEFNLGTIIEQAIKRIK